MDIRQLRYLIALAREKHFTRAADACAVTQPTLSGRLRQLEMDLGVAIIRRGHRYHGLTPEGERVLAWARRIVDDYDRMFEDLAIQSGASTGQVTLSVIPSALPVAAHIPTLFRRHQPNVRFSIRSRTLTQIDRELEDFEIDVGITYLAETPDRARWKQPLYIERYALFVRDGHPLAGRGSVRWAEAADHPLCALTSDNQNRRIVDEAFQKAGCRPVPAVESNSVVTLCMLVRSGGFGCVLPEHFQSVVGEDGDIRAIPLCEPTVEHAVGMVALQQEPQPALIAALFRTIPDFGRTRPTGSGEAESRS